MKRIIMIQADDEDTCNLIADKVREVITRHSDLAYVDIIDFIEEN